MEDTRLEPLTLCLPLVTCRSPLVSGISAFLPTGSMIRKGNSVFYIGFKELVGSLRRVGDLQVHSSKVSPRHLNVHSAVTVGVVDSLLVGLALCTFRLSKERSTDRLFLASGIQSLLGLVQFSSPPDVHLLM